MKLGSKHTKETKRKISFAAKDRVFSEETRHKISQACMGEKNGHYGKHHSIEARRKIAAAHRGKKRKPFSEETRRKMGEWQRGSKHYNWKGGLSENSQKQLAIRQWNKIRYNVYKRDNYTCQSCGISGIGMCAHHIIPWEISKDDRLENLMTLCISCHMQIHRKTNKNKKAYYG